ncbi:hypothetical protein ACIQUM_42940 [Amycolatopsis azurea]|uniref:hypothetical protein n=1 Tax=Amycolatopsis azurea TaxID=36819 RepID=UPI00381BC144
MTSPAEQLESALTATLEEKAARGHTKPPTRGWHPGARVGATAEHGALLAYNDNGADGICNLASGLGTWLNLAPEGHDRDFTQRPYSVWRWRPAFNGDTVRLLGALAPEAARLELVAGRTVAEADVVDGTFAVEIAVDMVSLRDARGRLEAHDSRSDEGRAEFERLLADGRREMTQVEVRVYDSAGTVLYDSAAINATD